MAELLVDLLTGSLASAYTAGSGTMSVSVTSGVMPGSGTFSIRVNNAAIYQVTAVSGSGPWTLTVTLEVGSDVNVASSAGFSCVTTSRSLAAYVAENGGASSSLDIMSPDKDGGVVHVEKGEYHSFTAGVETTLVNYTGGDPGYVSLIQFFNTLNSAGYGAINDCNLRVYIDGSGSPDIDVPLKNIFCCEYGDGTPMQFDSTYLGVYTNGAAGGSTWQFGGKLGLPIPFATGVKVAVFNGTAVGGNVCGFQVIYHTNVVNTWPRTRRLKVAAGSVTSIAPNTVTTMVNASGLNPGRFIGGYFMIDGFGASTATAVLEGNFKIFLDGNTGTPDFEAPGTEDYPLMPFYFAARASGGTQCDQSGLIFHNTSITWGFYRLHLLDKIFFQNALKMTWQCGDTSEVSFTGNMARFTYTLFYYTE